MEEKNDLLSADVWLGVGGTPLIELSRLAAPLAPRARVFAKAEWHNPAGSVKDRPALWMIRRAEMDGRLSSDKTILDATSGNTGIAYAWLAARLGYRVVLAVPETISEERRRILAAYGAKLEFTSGLEGSDGAIRKARALFAASPQDYFYPDQYNNDDNWRAHYLTTAEEIWRQTGGRITHFVTGLGTSGTFRGTATRLRELGRVHCAAMQPDSPMHGLEGLKHMPSSIVPGICDPRLADEDMAIDTESALRMTARAAKEEGLLLGLSGAANVCAALKLARREADAGRDALVVTVLPDSGERYLAELSRNRN